MGRTSIPRFYLSAPIKDQIARNLFLMQVSCFSSLSKNLPCLGNLGFRENSVSRWKEAYVYSNPFKSKSVLATSPSQSFAAMAHQTDVFSVVCLSLVSDL